MSTPLTKEQALIITGFTGIQCCQDFGDFHADVERRLEMAVFTHQLPALADRIKDAYNDDFMAMLKAGYADGATLAGENDRLLEGKVQDAETIHVLEQALTKCVASLDQLLPYLAKVPADVGLLNGALMAARPLLEKRT